MPGLARRMRCCETCGVGMGIMAFSVYEERFMTHAGLCPYCGKPAVKKEKPIEESWISLTGANAVYKISANKLSKLILAGEIPWRHGSPLASGRQVPEKALIKYGRRMK